MEKTWTKQHVRTNDNYDMKTWTKPHDRTNDNYVMKKTWTKQYDRTNDNYVMKKTWTKQHVRTDLKISHPPLQLRNSELGELPGRLGQRAPVALVLEPQKQGGPAELPQENGCRASTGNRCHLPSK